MKSSLRPDNQNHSDQSVSIVSDSTKTVVGIDNGVSGALVALDQYTGDITAKLPMPVVKSRKGNEVDVRVVYDWLIRCNAVQVVIEEPGGSKSAAAAASMAGSFHALRTVCALANFRTERVTPQKWQKEMIPGCKTGESKLRALEAAKRQWPGETFLISDRCKKPHDGLIDAALIAEYGRRKLILNGAPETIQKQKRPASKRKRAAKVISENSAN